MTRHWRLLDTGDRPGDWNMAVDAAILEGYRRGIVPATLRIYGWLPDTLTLGYSQVASPELLELATQSGVEVVRRPTGGRAVLHTGSLTYSVAAGSAEGFDASIHRSYAQVSGAIAIALNNLGCQVDIPQSSPSYHHSLSCFAVSTPADIAWRSRKLVGSAQVRKGDAFLQHGSIMLDVPRELLVALALDDQGMVDTREILGRSLEIQLLKSTLIAAFQSTFGAEIITGELTDWELAFAEERKGSFSP